MVSEFFSAARNRTKLYETLFFDKKLILFRIFLTNIFYMMGRYRTPTATERDLLIFSEYFHLQNPKKTAKKCDNLGKIRRKISSQNFVEKFCREILPRTFTTEICEIFAKILFFTKKISFLTKSFDFLQVSIFYNFRFFFQKIYLKENILTFRRPYGTAIWAFHPFRTNFLGHFGKLLY